MNHKQQIKFVKEEIFRAKVERDSRKYIAYAVENNVLLLLLMLGDKYNFDNKQMEETLDYIVNQATALRNDSRAGIKNENNDIIEVLKNEYDFDFLGYYEKTIKKVELEEEKLNDKS